MLLLLLTLLGGLPLSLPQVILSSSVHPAFRCGWVCATVFGQAQWQLAPPAWDTGNLGRGKNGGTRRHHAQRWGGYGRLS